MHMRAGFVCHPAPTTHVFKFEWEFVIAFVALLLLGLGGIGAVPTAIACANGAYHKKRHRLLAGSEVLLDQGLDLLEQGVDRPALNAGDPAAVFRARVVRI